MSKILLLIVSATVAISLLFYFTRGEGEQANDGVAKHRTQETEVRSDSNSTSASDCADCETCNSCEANATVSLVSPAVTIRWKTRDLGVVACDRQLKVANIIESSLGQVRDSLVSLGVEVTVERSFMSADECLSNPSLLNQLWVNGVAVENLIPGAEVSLDRCCEECGSRTVRHLKSGPGNELGISTEQLMHASLIAAGRSVEQYHDDLVFAASLPGGG